MTKTLSISLSLLLCAPVFAETKSIPEKPEALKLETLVLDKELWSLSPAEFGEKYKKNGFAFMSAVKKDLRSEGNAFTFFDKPAGEVVVRSSNGRISDVAISLFNRGDDRPLKLADFNERRDDALEQLNKNTGVRPRDISKSGTVKLDRQLWMWEKSAILLEKSVSRDGATPEFLRLKMKARGATQSGISNRSSLNTNVERDRESGDVYIKNVPMIDQGKKGYCAVASAARVYQYYGLEIDQHELAQISGSNASYGTSLGEMVAALKKVTRHLHTKVLVLYEFPKGLADKMPNEDSSHADYSRMIKNYNLGLKEYARDIKNYNRIAKKQGKTEFPDDCQTGVVNRELFNMQCDKDIYRNVMVKKSGYPRFQNKIHTYIDQGIPVGWCLILGMFKEENLPQSIGGHMRLIIGYNKKTEELIYTDSWGNGHGMKRMKAADAFCMSTGLLVLPPTR